MTRTTWSPTPLGPGLPGIPRLDAGALRLLRLRHRLRPGRGGRPGGAAGRARAGRRTSRSAWSPSAAPASAARCCAGWSPRTRWPAGRCPGCGWSWSPARGSTRPRCRRATGWRCTAYVPGLHRLLAACDLAIVHGGLSTTMELTALPPAVPVRAAAQPLRAEPSTCGTGSTRYGAGRCLDWDETDPDGLAAAIAAEIGRDGRLPAGRARRRRPGRGPARRAALSRPSRARRLDYPRWWCGERACRGRDTGEGRAAAARQAAGPGPLPAGGRVVAPGGGAGGRHLAAEREQRLPAGPGGGARSGASTAAARSGSPRGQPGAGDRQVGVGAEQPGSAGGRGDRRPAARRPGRAGPGRRSPRPAAPGRAAGSASARLRSACRDAAVSSGTAAVRSPASSSVVAEERVRRGRNQACDALRGGHRDRLRPSASASPRRPRSRAPSRGARRTTASYEPVAGCAG